MGVLLIIQAVINAPSLPARQAELQVRKENRKNLLETILKYGIIP
jgi:hypothetical protein